MSNATVRKIKTSAAGTPGTCQLDSRLCHFKNFDKWHFLFLWSRFSKSFFLAVCNSCHWSCIWAEAAQNFEECRSPANGLFLMKHWHCSQIKLGTCSVRTCASGSLDEKCAVIMKEIQNSRRSKSMQIKSNFKVLLVNFIRTQSQKSHKEKVLFLFNYQYAF